MSKSIVDKTTVNCQRCNRQCRAGTQGNPQGQVFHRAAKGMCASCATMCFLKTSALWDNVISAPNFDFAAALRLPHVQAQFAQAIKVSGSPEFSGEIDWEAVIENWNLPIPKEWDWKGDIRMYVKRGKR